MFPLSALRQQSELERGKKLFRTVPNAFPPKKGIFFFFWLWNNCVLFFGQAATSNYLRTHYLTFPFSPSKEKGEIPCFCART